MSSDEPASEVYDPEYGWCGLDAYEAEIVPDAARDLLDRVVDIACRASTLAAEQLSWVAAFRDDAHAQDAGTVSAELIDRAVRLELASALHITEYRAGAMLTLADRLVHRQRAVLDALRVASITLDHAEILSGVVDSIEIEHRDTVLERGLDLARRRPVGTFRRALKRLVDTLRTETLPERHRREVQARRVVVETLDDGMAWLHWYGPAVEAHAVYGRLTSMAVAMREAEGETRTRDQLRADAMADLLIDGSCSAHPEAVRGIRPTVVVTVPVLSLLSNENARGRYGGDPPVVDGVGPIPLDTARELAGGCEGWMRVLTHPETGMVLSVGRDRYRPPPGLAKLVKWRADRCVAPGCGIPASRCQIDHAIAWAHGGATALENLGPLCQGHHTVKHHSGWTIREIDAGGAVEWFSSPGRRYVVQPERRVPVFRAVDGEETAGVDGRPGFGGSARARAERGVGGRGGAGVRDGAQTRAAAGPAPF